MIKKCDHCQFTMDGDKVVRTPDGKVLAAFVDVDGKEKAPKVTGDV